MTTKRAALAAIFIFLGPPARAAGPGSTGANFLKIGVGPRPVALGETFVGLADDVNTIAYNPAGIARLERHEVTFSHNEFIRGVRQEWLAGSFGGETHAFGFAANLVMVEPIPAFDELNAPIGTTQAQDMYYQGVYGLRMGEFSVGVGAKFLRSTLDGVSATALVGDFGVHYEPVRDFGMGASLLNVGQGQKFDRETFTLPSSFKVGFAVRPLASLDLKRFGLTLLSDVTVPNDGATYPSFGAEATVYSGLALRMGWRANRGVSRGLSLGSGLRLTQEAYAGPALFFDYSLADLGDLGMTHRVSFTARFGQRGARVNPMTLRDRIDTNNNLRQRYEEAEKKTAPRKKAAAPRPTQPAPETSNQDSQMWLSPTW